MARPIQIEHGRRRLLSPKEVDFLCGLSKSQRYNLVKAGKFPRPVRLAGTRRVVWDSVVIDGWIEQQVEKGEANEF